MFAFPVLVMLGHPVSLERDAGAGLVIAVATAFSALLLHFFCQRFLSTCIFATRKKLCSWVHSHVRMFTNMFDVSQLHMLKRAFYSMHCVCVFMISVGDRYTHEYCFHW